MRLAPLTSAPPSCPMCHPSCDHVCNASGEHAQAFALPFFVPFVAFVNEPHFIKTECVHCGRPILRSAALRAAACSDCLPYPKLQSFPAAAAWKAALRRRGMPCLWDQRFALEVPEFLFAAEEMVAVFLGKVGIGQTLVHGGAKLIELREDELGLEEVFLRVTRGETQ